MVSSKKKKFVFPFFNYLDKRVDRLDITQPTLALLLKARILSEDMKTFVSESVMLGHDCWFI